MQTQPAQSVTFSDERFDQCQFQHHNQSLNHAVFNVISKCANDDLLATRIVLHPQKSLAVTEQSSFLHRKPPACFLFNSVKAIYFFSIIFSLIFTNRNCVETKCIKDLLSDIILAQRVLKCQIKSGSMLMR